MTKLFTLSVLLFAMGLLVGACNKEDIEDNLDSRNSQNESLYQVYLKAYNTMCEKVGDTEVSNMNATVSLISDIREDNTDSISSIIKYNAASEEYCSNVEETANEIDNSIDDYELSILDGFIEVFGLDDYLWLKQSFDAYIAEGGNSTFQMESLCKDKSESLKIIFASVCGVLDWYSELSTINGIALYSETRSIISDGNINELSCRKVYWSKISLMAIANGVDIGLDIAGIVIPGVAELDAAADLLGLADATLDYYACVRNGIR